jgi:hypothetical protein
MSNLEAVSVLSFLNHPGSLGAPFTQSGFGFVIPIAKHFIKIDYAKFIETPRQYELDIKNY